MENKFIANSGNLLFPDLAGLSVPKSGTAESPLFVPMKVSLYASNYYPQILYNERWQRPALARHRSHLRTLSQSRPAS